MLRWRPLVASALVAAALGVVEAPPASAGPGEGEVLALGDAAPVPGAAPEGVVGLAGTPTGLGWWAVAGDGRVTAAGDAVHRGDASGLPLRAPVAGMAASPSGGGYWLVAPDGGVFTYGDAAFRGSAGDLPLVRPVVGMAATPSGAGYWLVASDGGVFTYGDAPFLGSTGGLPLVAPIVGMAATASGRGYWLVADDGGVFTFGDARFAGVGEPGTTAIVAAAAGYWVLQGDGRVLARGGAPEVTGPGPLEGSAVAADATPSGLGLRVAVGVPRDVVDVWEPGGLSAGVQQWALDAGARVGARVTVWHRANLDLLAVRRGDHVVQAPPPGFRFPMSTVAVDPVHSVALVGRTVAGILADGDVALGRASAGLRGAQVGDIVELLGWDGRSHRRRVGAIADDARTGSAEVLLSVETGRAMGFDRPWTVRLWGPGRAVLEEATAAGRPSGIGVERSWVADVDWIASLVRLKQVLGEMAYRPARGDAVQLDPAWTANIVTERVPGLGAVTCHRAVFASLRGAMTEVVRAGLGGSLGRYGGCYAPRLVRGGDSGGALSRHSFGIAVDLNITNNVFGGQVSMHPRIVEIFRRWGFAWGGTWVRADGMHFEWQAT